jgi:hypothetical protein
MTCRYKKTAQKVLRDVTQAGRIDLTVFLFWLDASSIVDRRYRSLPNEGICYPVSRCCFASAFPLNESILFCHVMVEQMSLLLSF